MGDGECRKIYDFYLPPAFLRLYDGPSIILEGRGMSNLAIEPKLGLEPKPFGEACYSVWRGDFIKNEEPEGNQMNERFLEVMEALLASDVGTTSFGKMEGDAHVLQEEALDWYDELTDDELPPPEGVELIVMLSSEFLQSLRGLAAEQQDLEIPARSPFERDLGDLGHVTLPPHSREEGACPTPV